MSLLEEPHILVYVRCSECGGEWHGTPRSYYSRIHGQTRICNGELGNNPHHCSAPRVSQSTYERVKGKKWVDTDPPARSTWT